MRILAAVLLIGSAFEACADEMAYAPGDVFYCEMTMFLDYDSETKKIDHQFLDKFKFSIYNSDTIRFGEGSWFSRQEFQISVLAGDLFFARDKFGSISFYAGKFNYAGAFYSGSRLISAVCDRF